MFGLQMRLENDLTNGSFKKWVTWLTGFVLFKQNISDAHGINMKTALFILGRATSLGEGKLWIHFSLVKLLWKHLL